MAGDKESTLVFKVDGTQAETGVAKVKRALHDLADTASREGQRGAAGIAGMGAGAEKSAAQIERSTQRQIGEIRRMTAEIEAGGKATRAYQEAMASIRGVDSSALRPYLDQLEALKVKQAEIAKQSAAMASADNFVAGLRSQIAALREQIALQGMSTEEAMRYRAAQLGAASAAAPLILQLQNMRAAQSAVAEAARAEAAAQKQAAAASADRKSFIQSLQSQASAIGKTRAELLELKAAQLGVTQQAAPFIAKLREAETGFGKVGITAGQMSNALSMVPMQFTDIVTSLASGQNAFTVFIQQGGQLKDMFGGVGVAAKALGTYVLGLINPFTLAAGAAALLATAYYQGSKESAAYNTAIVMSGNAAGVTAGQLGDMARAMQSATRTQSAASAALAEMAQNSRVGSEELQRYTTVAMDFEKVTGTAVSKTAEAFASLAKEPLQAAIKLNDGVNWLTTSTYEHIKSLEEQGRKTDAARVAQESYANSVAQRTAQLQGNLGALEKTWNALAGAAKWAWDAMLNVGRKETLGDQLEGARKQLADAERQANIRSAGAFGTFQAGQEPSNRAAIDALKQKIALLSEQERMLKRGAEAQAAANAQVQARISLDAKYGDRLKTDAQKAKAARDEIAELGRAAGKSAEEIKRLQDASDATFAKKGGGGGGSKRTSAAPGENEIARIKAMIEEEQRYIAALQERGKEAEKLTAGEKLVLKLQQELQTSVSGATKASKEKALAAAQELVAVEKTRIAEEKRLKTDEEARKRLIASIDEERAARMKLAEESAKRVDAIGKDNERMREEIETLGLSAAQIAARTIEVNNATIAEKENQLARLQNDNISTREMAALEEEIKLLKERNGLIGQRSQKNEMLEAQRAQLDMWKSIDQTAHDVFVNIFEDGAGTFKRLGKTLEAAVLDVLYQMTVKRWIIHIGASFTGQPIDVVSQALGGGQGGGAGGILGGASNGNSILNFGSLISNWMGAGSGAAAGTLAYGNMIGALGGDGLGAFMAANGGWGTSGAGALAGSAAPLAGLAVVAAPLIIGALIESNSRDRFSGAAYATTGGGDPLSRVVAGSTNFDYMTGDLPDRAALMARLEELGAPMEAISDWNDRALARFLLTYSGPWEPGATRNPRIADFSDYADFYRGAGYTHPEAMGWWNNKGNSLVSTDPRVIEASRNVALSIIEPLETMSRLIGDEATYRATVGFANRGEGNGVWAGFDLQRDGQSVAGWVNQDDYHSVGEGMRAMYSSALEALDSLDLPGWAAGMVADARTQLDGLSGEQVGQQAAALYQQTTAGIAQMYKSIQMLIDVFPDFATATQDSVHAIATAMGGLQNLTTAYNSYLEGFYSEEERRALAMKLLGAQFADLGVALPDSRDAFRALVESQDLSTEAGQRMFAALMGLAGAFAAVTPAIDATADAAQSAADILNATRSATDDAFSALEKFIGSQRDMWQTALDAAESLIDEARSIFDTAGGAARELWGQQDETSAMLASEGNAAIRQMLDSLRATGALPDADALSRAIDGARGGLDPAAYARTADQEFAQRVLAGQLGEMSDLAGGQMTVAEQQADYAKQQIKQLDDTLDHWRKQLDLMRNTDLTVTSIADGIGKLVAAMEEERAAQAALDAARNTPAPSTGNPANAGWAIGGSSGSVGGSGGAYLDYTTFTRQYADGSSALLNMNEVWMALLQSSGDRAAAEAAYAAEEERRRREGIPSFDVGTNYVPRDMIAQIHEGERIIPAADNARLMALLANASQGGQNDALVAEVKALRAEVTALRAERTAADVPLHRMAGQFANVTAGGNAMMTEKA